VARPAAARPPPAAEALATTQASTQDARRAARNVFDAKRRPVRTARGPWGLLGVTAVLVAVLSVGGYYAAMTFTTVQPSSLAISRQPVSRPPALPPESGPPAGTPAPAPAASAPTTVAQAPSAPAVAVPSTAAGTPAPAAPAAPGPGVAAQAPAPQAPALPARTPTEEEAYRLATSAPATRRPPAETAVQAVAQATPPTLPAVRAPAPAAERASGPAEPASGALFPEPPGPAASAPRSAPVRVAARAAPDPTYTNLTRAYNAYQAGSYSEARRLYQQVLAREPTNRDALLGLGAVNAAEGRTDQARAAYQRALILNPRDEVAAAGMMSLRSGGAPQDEARLRQLVQQQPGASHLRFALGNTYAAQGRWSEAQQAYFDAFRGDSRNADYAFNLAVSLDHLAQARSALDYYRRALALGGGRFDADAARERIRVLEESGSGS
jgi:tetratricopeptide (TPR) repeat protein